MSRATQTWIIVGALLLSVAAIIFFFRPQPTPSVQLPPSTPTEAVDAAAPLPSPKPKAAMSPPVSEAPKGEPFTEVHDDITLTFVPGDERPRLIKFAKPVISRQEDSSCTLPYTAREKVTKTTYAWGFVIDRFNTMNDKEGQQEYMPYERELPRAFQGSLHDFVREGRTVTVEKQRCGMGQVEFLVSVKP